MLMSNASRPRNNRLASPAVPHKIDGVLAGADRSILRCLRLRRVRGHADRVRAHRRVFRVLRQDQAEHHLGIPDGRQDHGDIPHIDVPHSQLHFRDQYFGHSCGNVYVRHAILDDNSLRGFRLLGHGVRIPASLLQATNNLELRISKPAIQSDGSSARFDFVSDKNVAIYPYRDLRTRVGLQPSYRDQLAPGDAGRLRRLHLLHYAGRTESRRLDGHGPDHNNGRGAGNRPLYGNGECRRIRRGLGEERQGRQDRIFQLRLGPDHTALLLDRDDRQFFLLDGVVFHKPGHGAEVSGHAVPPFRQDNRRHLSLRHHGPGVDVLLPGPHHLRVLLQVRSRHAGRHPQIRPAAAVLRHADRGQHARTARPVRQRRVQRSPKFHVDGIELHDGRHLRGPDKADDKEAAHRGPGQLPDEGHRRHHRQHLRGARLRRGEDGRGPHPGLGQPGGHYRRPPTRHLLPGNVLPAGQSRGGAGGRPGERGPHHVDLDRHADEDGAGPGPLPAEAGLGGGLQRQLGGGVPEPDVVAGRDAEARGAPLRALQAVVHVLHGAGHRDGARRRAVGELRDGRQQVQEGQRGPALPRRLQVLGQEEERDQRERDRRQDRIEHGQVTGPDSLFNALN